MHDFHMDKGILEYSFQRLSWPNVWSSVLNGKRFDILLRTIDQFSDVNGFNRNLVVLRS